AALRRVRIQHGPRADDATGAPLPHGGDGVARGVATDLRRRGLRPRGRAVHRRRGPRLAGLRRALRRQPPRRRPARPLGGRRARDAQEAAPAHPDHGRPTAGVGLRARRLRGRPALRALHRRALRRGRGRRRARRLRPRAARAPLPLRGTGTGAELGPL
ncbi:MAG: AIG2-like domain protein, partial [uncultured Actinomycetospora sp.]